MADDVFTIDLTTSTTPSGTDTLIGNFSGTTGKSTVQNVVESVLKTSAGATRIYYTGNQAGEQTVALNTALNDRPSITYWPTITLADAVNIPKFVPFSGATTTLGPTQLTGPYYGDGNITDSAGNKRARYFGAIKAAPSSLGNEGSIETAFNGDMKMTLFPVEYRVTGAATLGQPTSGYLYVPEATPHYTSMYSSSGWNNSTSSNTGRTAATAYRTRIYNAGQGDMVCYNASAFVTGTLASSTSFLANPAASLFNGDISAGADGVYLNPYEIGLVDNGFDVAGGGTVVKMTRTNSTGAKSAWWFGYRSQSMGSSPVNVGYSVYGPHDIGFDTSMATLTSSGTYTSAAFTAKADQRFYLNANATDSSGLGRYSASLGTDYFSYSSGLSAFNFVVGNASALQIYTSQVLSNRPFIVGRAGDGLRVKEGSNAKQGTATLAAGTVVVSNTSVTASSRIFLTIQSLGTVASPKAIAVTARSAGTSFTITSADATDTSVVAYEIFEPG